MIEATYKITCPLCGMFEEFKTREIHVPEKSIFPNWEGIKVQVILVENRGETTQKSYTLQHLNLCNKCIEKAVRLRLERDEKFNQKLSLTEEQGE